jgi:HK97 family phage portal protein
MSLISDALMRWLPIQTRVPGGRPREAESLGTNKESTPGTINKGTVTGPLIAYQTLGEPVWAPRDYSAFAREGFMQNAIVYRSVRMIAEAAASIPLLLYEGTNEIETHPLLDLLRRPSLDHTGTDFLEAWYGFLLVAGNAYVEAVALDGELRELHILRPDRMKVIPGLDGWPEGYEYTACGRSVRFTGDVVEGVRPILHLKLFHPINDHYGMSPIEAAATAIDIHNTASGWNKALLDNSARPSGALVYAASNGQMTEDQFTRLKTELETSFQGARAAGRPLLLEGGLDWKPLSLTPKDMDFIEAKNVAAREIALAIGVPPMLLGIPGDNTYSNYQEAQRAFWRQTVLPLVNRTARALSSWLSSAFAESLLALGDSPPGSRPPSALELRPDLDQIEALAPERDALWKRLESTSFLTDDEKRAAAGYAAKGGAGQPTRPFERGSKFNPNHDELGRFATASGATASGASDDGAQVAQTRRPSSTVRIGGQMVDATPAEIMRLSIATSAANAATARVREIDPNWRPSAQAYESIEGAISAREAEAREAETRFQELRRDAVPNTNASWGVNRLRKELNNQGYRFVEPTDAEGYLYRNDAGAEVRIMKRPNAQYRTDPFQKHQNDYYYRYRSGVDQGWGQHTTIPEKLNERKGIEEE